MPGDSLVVASEKSCQCAASPSPACSGYLYLGTRTCAAIPSPAVDSVLTEPSPEVGALCLLSVHCARAWRAKCVMLLSKNANAIQLVFNPFLHHT